MNRLHLVFTLVISVICIFHPDLSDSCTNAREVYWRDTSQGMLDLDLTAVEFSTDCQYAFAWTPRILYKSSDRGSSWKKVFQVQTAGQPLLDIETERERRLRRSRRFDRNQYNPDDLIRAEVIDSEDEFDDLSDSELKERIEDANLLIAPERDEQSDPARLEAQKIVNQESSEKILDVDWGTPGIGYLLTDQRLYVSNDYGTTWEQTSPVLPVSVGKLIRVLVILPVGHVVATDGSSLVMSYDSCKTFNFLENYGPTILPGTRLAISNDRANVLVFTGNRIDVISSTGVLLRSITMDKVAERIDPDWFYFSGDDCFCAVNNGLYYLMDSRIWTRIPDLFLGGAAIADISASNRYVTVATDRGVFFWDRASIVGEFRNTGLTELDITALAECQDDGDLLLATTRTGLFSLTSGKIVDQAAKKPKWIPAGFPELESLISAAIDYAELDKSPREYSTKSARIRALYPVVTMDFDYACDDWEDYQKSRVIAFSDGFPYLGPFDESYGHDRHNRYDFSLKLKWDPAYWAFDTDRMRIRKQLSGEAVRKQELIAEILKKYVALSELYQSGTIVTGTFGQVQRQLKISQLLAELDALTGFRFQLSKAS